MFSDNDIVNKIFQGTNQQENQNNLQSMIPQIMSGGGGGTPNEGFLGAESKYYPNMEAARQSVEGKAPEITGEGDLANIGLNFAMGKVLGNAIGGLYNTYAEGVSNTAPSVAETVMSAAKPSGSFVRNPGQVVNNSILTARQGIPVADMGAESAGYGALLKNTLPTQTQHQAIYNELPRQIAQFKPGGLLSGMVEPKTLNTLQNYTQHGMLTNRVQDALRNIYGGY